MRGNRPAAVAAWPAATEPAQRASRLARRRTSAWLTASCQCAGATPETNSPRPRPKCATARYRMRAAATRANRDPRDRAHKAPQHPANQSPCADSQPARSQVRRDPAKGSRHETSENAGLVSIRRTIDGKFTAHAFQNLVSRSAGQSMQLYELLSGIPDTPVEATCEVALCPLELRIGALGTRRDSTEPRARLALKIQFLEDFRIGSGRGKLLGQRLHRFPEDGEVSLPPGL